jgi:hypothetical protein
MRLFDLSLDPFGWVSEYRKYHFGPLHPFVTYPEGQTGIFDMGGSDGERVRLTLAADWGAGTEETAAVGAFIGDDKPDWTVHVGDTYYVGTPEEVKSHLLGVAPEGVTHGVEWPSGSKGRFALNGNHEMVGRGFGYFDFALPSFGPVLPSGGWAGQNASFAVLENQFWRVLLLDTGYTSFEKDGIFSNNVSQPAEVMEWLTNVVNLGNPEDKRGIVIMTHHQFDSAFQGQILHTANQLKPLLGDKVPLWFWGHEHRLAFYNPVAIEGTNLTAHGRCVGNGGYPVDVHHLPIRKAGLKMFDERLYQDESEVDKVGLNGWVTLDFKAAALTATYYTIRRDGKSYPPRPDWVNRDMVVQETFSLDPSGSVVLNSQHVFNDSMVIVS